MEPEMVAAYRVLAREIDQDIAVAEQRLANLRAQRENLMAHMRNDGATYDQIASVLNITRQRAWQKLKAV